MKSLTLVTFTFAALFFGAGCAQNSNPKDTKLLAQQNPGQFVSIGNHTVKGGVKIETRNDGSYLVIDDNFNSTAGPDLRLVLRDSSGNSQMQIVAPLAKTQGSQEYLLDLDSSLLNQFNEVAVYCAKFHVDFGIAKIR